VRGQSVIERRIRRSRSRRDLDSDDADVASSSLRHSSSYPANSKFNGAALRAVKRSLITVNGLDAVLDSRCVLMLTVSRSARQNSPRRPRLA
jgi:hypothetical protein